MGSNFEIINNYEFVVWLFYEILFVIVVFGYFFYWRVIIIVVNVLIIIIVGFILKDKWKEVVINFKLLILYLILCVVFSFSFDILVFFLFVGSDLLLLMLFFLVIKFCSCFKNDVLCGLIIFILLLFKIFVN